MILDENTKNTILNATHVAKTFNIESFIVEPHIIRGLISDRTVAIHTPVDIDFGCELMGINRIDVLHARLSLIDDNSTIECITTSNEADLLKIKSKNLSIEYRCARTLAIKCHKQMNLPDQYRLPIDKELIHVLNKSKAAMKSESITIMCDNDTIKYKIADENNDQLLFTHNDIGFLMDAPNNFVYDYSTKLLLQAMTLSSLDHFFITEKAMLHFNIKNIDVFIPRKV